MWSAHGGDKTGREAPWACSARWRRGGGALLGVLLAWLTAAPSAAEMVGNDLADMSLEELMQVQVTSATGVAQHWFDTPAAMHVITGEDIHSSGHRQLAELLRLAPGIQVGRLNSNTWAVGSRGFGLRFATNLLVLIDGRTVYDPLFSGTFWDIQDPLLEDVDQVEVIRGPGATLWGANAVNGVINVMSKSADQTQGFYLNAGGGSEQRAFGAFRYGGQLDDRNFFRVWGKYQMLDATRPPAGVDDADDWDLAHLGFRWDSFATEQLHLLVDSAFYFSDRLGDSARLASPTGHLATTVVSGDNRVSGGHLLARLQTRDPDGPGWSLQAYYDRTDRTYAGFGVTRDTLDLDWRQRLRLVEAHDLMWGAGIRHTSDATSASRVLSFNPTDEQEYVLSAFIQDTITLQPNHWFATLGTKLEYNNHTHFEIQPSARLLWQPDERQRLWAAVSRPVRRPSRTADDLNLIAAYADTGLLGGGPPSGVIVPLRVTGTRSNEAEELLAYELGYRLQLASRATLDLAAFFNDYHKLINIPAGGVDAFTNRASAESYGAELSAQWQVSDQLRLTGSYSFVRVQVHGPSTLEAEGATPRHQAQAHARWRFHKDWEFNGGLYYTDSVPAHAVGSHIRLDLGVTWRPRPNLEVSIWGQDLLDPSHPEAMDSFFGPGLHEVQRGVYAQVAIRY